MKLRNKKTGESGKLTYLNFEIGIDEKETDLTILLDNTDGECIDRQFYSLDELKKYLDEWEDYKPKEPLIKDEKVRKAVRAWAEANDVEEADYWNSDYRFQDAQGGSSISFESNPIETKNRYGNGVYTIAELCGEEKE